MSIILLLLPLFLTAVRPRLPWAEPGIRPLGWVNLWLIAQPLQAETLPPTEHHPMDPSSGVKTLLLLRGRWDGREMAPSLFLFFSSVVRRPFMLEISSKVPPVVLSLCCGPEAKARLSVHCPTPPEAVYLFSPQFRLAHSPFLLDRQCGVQS